MMISSSARWFNVIGLLSTQKWQEKLHSVLDLECGRYQRQSSRFCWRCERAFNALVAGLTQRDSKYRQVYEKTLYDILYT